MAQAQSLPQELPSRSGTVINASSSLTWSLCANHSPQESLGRNDGGEETVQHSGTMFLSFKALRGSSLPVEVEVTLPGRRDLVPVSHPTSSPWAGLQGAYNPYANTTPAHSRRWAFLPIVPLQTSIPLFFAWLVSGVSQPTSGITFSWRLFLNRNHVKTARHGPRSHHPCNPLGPSICIVSKGSP